MELVYLWVQDYKNIHEQGFNFSPHFTCKYENNELTITPKDPEPVSIFPPNINVTAIVGENGSGKSSLLSSIITKAKIFFVIQKNKELVIYTNNIPIKSKLFQKPFSRSLLKNMMYYSMDNLSLAKTQNFLSVIDFERINFLTTRFYKELQKVDVDIFNFKPYYIQYKFIDYWFSSEDISADDVHAVKLALNWEGNADSSEIWDILKLLADVDDDYLIYLFNRFGTISEIFEYINLFDYVHPKDGYLTIKYEDIQEQLKVCELSFCSKEDFELLKAKEYNFIPIETLQTDLTENYEKLLFETMVDDLEFDFMGENQATFSSLSHGEKTIYSFLVYLIAYDKDDFLLLLDEPDNTLHPNWQKAFLNEMMNILLKLGKKPHILITSHSPFILSDLPKENVIFLKNGKQEDPNIETFGANIHTLLSHGFFMKDGLMGEFAKEKINKAIEYLNKIKLEPDEIKYCEEIISIIGEPIVKRQLQRMLDSKKLDKMKEIDALKNQIEDLQSRLENLEKKS